MTNSDEFSLIRKLTDTDKKETEVITRSPEEDIVEMFGRKPMLDLDKVTLKTYYAGMRSNDPKTYEVCKGHAETLLQKRWEQGFNTQMHKSYFDSLVRRQDKRFGFV